MERKKSTFGSNAKSKNSNRRIRKGDSPAFPTSLTPPRTPVSEDQNCSDNDNSDGDTSITNFQGKGRGKKNVKINLNESEDQGLAFETPVSEDQTCSDENINPDNISSIENLPKKGRVRKNVKIILNEDDNQSLASGNTSKIRANKKSEKFTKKSETKKSKNEKNADIHLSTTFKLQENLQERLERAKFKKKPNSEAIEIWNIISDSILKFLKGKTKSKLEIVKTGSYYDNTQVLQAAEFDALICIPQLRTIKVLYHPYDGIPDSSLCCLLKINSIRLPALMDEVSGSRTNESGKAYLNPRKLYSCFKSYIEEYLARQEDYLKDPIKDLNERKEKDNNGVVEDKVEVELQLVPVEDGCPAITLKAELANGSFYMDFVPAIKIFEWPPPAKDWTCSWIPEKITKAYKGLSYAPTECEKYRHYLNKYVYAVPKIHQSEKRLAFEECLYFQLSFCQIEKTIMKYDVKLENDHLKDVYKLLKQDLNDFYKDDNKKIICSFHIKHMLFTFRDKIGLQTDELSHCYLKSLETLIEAIKKESLPMFFIPDFFKSARRCGLLWNLPKLSTTVSAGISISWCMFLKASPLTVSIVDQR